MSESTFDCVCCSPCCCKGSFDGFKFKISGVVDSACLCEDALNKTFMVPAKLAAPCEGSLTIVQAYNCNGIFYCLPY